MMKTKLQIYKKYNEKVKIRKKEYFCDRRHVTLGFDRP